MSDLMARIGEAYTAYWDALGESYAAATKAAGEAQQQVGAEIFAATGGDDATRRMGAAWRRYQKDVATASYEHWKHVQAEQRRLVEAVAELQAEDVEAAFRRYLAQLDAGDDPGGTGGGNGDDPAAPHHGAPGGARGARRRPDGQSG